MIKKFYINNKITLLQIAVIFILTMAVYANSIHNEFTNWDDGGLIVNNTSIRSLNFEKIINILTPHKGSTFQPMRVLSYAIDYKISKLNPVTFHIHNMILHGFAAIFLYLLLLEILPLIGAAKFANKEKTDNVLNDKIKFYRNAAFLTALLFAIHPINVESVTWLSGRKYTQLTFYGFFAFLLFVKSSKNDVFHPVTYIFSFIFTIISILSSPFGIAFPVLFFLFDYCRDDKLNPFSVFKKRFIYFAPYLSLTIFFLFLFSQTIISLGGKQGGTGGTRVHAHTHGILPFFYTAAGVLFDYVRNIITPFWLSNRYLDVSYYSIFFAKILISIATILTLIVATIIRTVKGKKLLLFCFGWTFIAWLPTSNIIPISTLMADRYFYLAVPGLFILFSITVVTLFSKIQNSNFRKFGFIIFIIVLSGYLIPFTLQANRVWKNSKTLWQNCTKRDPSYLSAIGLSATFVSDWDTYENKEKLNEAISVLTDATRQNPTVQDAFINMGTLFARNKDYVLSIVYYKHALQVSSEREFGIKKDLASVFTENGNYKEAMDIYFELLKKQPDNQFFIDRLEKNYGSIQQDLKALKFEPQYIETIYNKAVMLEKTDNPKKAKNLYLQLLEYAPNHASGHNNIGAIFFREGNIDKAIFHFKQFIKAKPTSVMGHCNLAICYLKQKNIPSSRNYFRAVLLLDPNNKTAQKGITALRKLL